MRFSQFFSLDSPKAIKARKYGWLNAINYMAPADFAGVGNLCPWSTVACRALCLGLHSGQAGMVKASEADTALNNVRQSRADKARMFMRDRKTFMANLIAGISRAKRKARREKLSLCVRLNGSTDIAWEGIKIAELANISVLDAFHLTQFVDYTKSVKRALRAVSDPTWPKNYRLCFSRSESNEADCLEVLRAGGTVAVVSTLARPAEWHGFPCIDGDAHDLRHLDPPGSVVWLKPKGNRAKKDQSGFVVR